MVEKGDKQMEESVKKRPCGEEGEQEREKNMNKEEDRHTWKEKKEIG